MVKLRGKDHGQTLRQGSWSNSEAGDHSQTPEARIMVKLRGRRSWSNSEAGDHGQTPEARIMVKLRGRRSWSNSEAGIMVKLRGKDHG